MVACCGGTAGEAAEAAAAAAAAAASAPPIRCGVGTEQVSLASAFSSSSGGWCADDVVAAIASAGDGGAGESDVGGSEGPNRARGEALNPARTPASELAPPRVTCGGATGRIVGIESDGK